MQRPVALSDEETLFVFTRCNTIVHKMHASGRILSKKTADGCQRHSTNAIPRRGSSPEETCFSRSTILPG